MLLSAYSTYSTSTYSTYFYLLSVYAPEAALGGFPGGRASHGEAGKGREAPCGVLQRERCLHAVCSERWGGPGQQKTPLRRLLPLLSRLSRGGPLGRPWVLYSSPRESL